MHEALLIGGTALGGYAALLAARLRWTWRRRRAPVEIGGRVRLGPLWEPSGGSFASGNLAHARAVVLVFMSNRCPGVKAYDGRLHRLNQTYAPRGVAVMGVNSADDGIHPGENPEEMAKVASERRLPFPYVKDRDQGVARSLGAVCTPQVFLLDREGRLRYRGRIDDALLEGRVKRRYLEDALESVLEGRPVPVTETAPLGCSIEFTRAPRKRNRSRPVATSTSA